MSDTDKKTFTETWPGGYEEVWNAFPGGNIWERRVADVGIKLYAGKDRDALEIGCGRGLWTLKYLCPYFRTVVAIDVIPQPENLHADNLIYVEAPDRDFTCYLVPDKSVDFVFSFNTFCHLSGDAQKTYLENIYRVLKPGGYAVAHFANYPRHGTPDPRRDPNLRSADGTCWFYNDLPMTLEWVYAAGFVEAQDLLPTFRDTLLEFRKP